MHRDDARAAPVGVDFHRVARLDGLAVTSAGGSHGSMTSRRLPKRRSLARDVARLVLVGTTVALAACGDPGTGPGPTPGPSPPPKRPRDAGADGANALDSGGRTRDATSEGVGSGSSTTPACAPLVTDASTDGPEGVYAMYSCATLANCCPLLVKNIPGIGVGPVGLCDDFVTYGDDIDCAGQEAIYRSYGWCLGDCQ